jgi:alkanesulfonate monooxygenase SsuD/methylene tetrahydromethanopterin reductase-like flavin-dependent oxidoreductase (luciferase family)
VAARIEESGVDELWLAEDCSFARAQVAWYRRAHLEPLGLVDDVTRLREECGSPDEFAARLPDEWIDQLTISGDPAQCAAKISRLHDAGARSLVLALPTHLPDHEPDLLPREVIALLRQAGLHLPLS